MSNRIVIIRARSEIGQPVFDRLLKDGYKMILECSIKKDNVYVANQSKVASGEEYDVSYIRPV